MASFAVRGLVATCLTASLMPLNSTMVAVAIPAIAAEFDRPAATVTQALVATYLITAIALQSPGGKLGDRLGQWRVFRIGQLAIGAGAILGFVTPSLWLLAGSRILMALGGALVVPATIALLRLELPPARRGRAFGSFGATMALAAAVGPIVGGVLVDAFSWEAVFIVNVPVLVCSGLLAASAPRRPTPRTQARFDWVGSALLTAALVLIVVGAEGGLVALWAVGLALLAPFAWWESRRDDPVVAFGLFRLRAFTAGTGVIALQNLAMYALLFELPLVLHALFDIDGRETGSLLLFLMVSMVALSLVAGRLTDRFGARPVAVVGSLLCLAGLAVLATSAFGSAGDVRVPLLLFGMGLGLCGPAAQSASMTAVPEAQSGMAAGVASTMRYLGGVVGIAILGRVLELGGGRGQILHEHRTLLAVFAVALLASLACSAALPGRPRRTDVSGSSHDARRA